MNTINPLRHTTKKTIRGHLLLDGFSIREFADDRGFSVNLVEQVIRRYCGSESVPRGEKTKAVLAALEPYAAGEQAVNN